MGRGQRETGERRSGGVEVMVLREVQEILGLKEEIGDREELLRQTHQFYELNQQLIQENNELKIKRSELEHELDLLRAKLIPGAEDEILQERQPSLY